MFHGEPAVIRFGDEAFFTFSSDSGASAQEAYLFGVTEGSFYEANISALPEKWYDQFYQEEDGKVYAVDSVYLDYHRWFRCPVEYDPETNLFTVYDNTDEENEILW